jgi:hypothetical protein
LSGRPVAGGVSSIGAPVMPFGAVFNLTTLNGLNGLRLDGATAGDRAGFSVGAVGDINGDGLADVVIGAYTADPGGRSSAGSAYVVFGKAGGWPSALNLSALDGATGFRIDGAVADDQAGLVVGAAGDINGDGVADMLVSSRWIDPGGTLNAGATYVVFGKTGGWSATLSLAALDGGNGFRIDGVADSDASGSSAAAAGDVNGDGIGDLIIGAQNADPAGRTDAGAGYVLFGKSEPWTATMSLASLNGQGGFRLNGVAAFDQSGRSVASAGDVNGDGYADIVIGAPSADPSGRNGAGSSYVVFGSAAPFAPALELSSLDGSNGFRIDGAFASDFTGEAVASAGDINGDGFGDLIIGASGADPFGRSSAGSSYVVFGKAGGWAATLAPSALNGLNGFRIDGAAPNDLSGVAVRGAGDINGDGFDDLLVGAPYADPSARSMAGSGYVIFGKASGWSFILDMANLTAATGFRMDGPAAGDELGWGIAGAGDMNGDGFADLIIGAQGADPGGRDGAGSAFVVFGDATGPISRGGGAGPDRLTGGGFNDSLAGGDGRDRLQGNAGDDTLSGGADSDTLFGGAGFDRLDGGEGVADWVEYGTSPAGVILIDGQVGVGGEAAGDVLSGIEFFRLSRSFADVFFGGSASETVFGDGGADTLFGNRGDDAFYAGEGDDILLGGDGADFLDGGPGFDAVFYGDSEGGVTIDLAQPDVNAGFAAGDGFNRVEAFLLTQSEDVMRGLDDSGAGDILFGLGGDDLLDGRGGFDWLLGGDGDDTLTGGFGYDLFSGGAGADRFVFNTGFEGGAFAGGGEVITDFEAGVDRIAFVSATSGVAAFIVGNNLFIQSGGPTGLLGTTTGSTLIYDSAAGALWFDSNGSLPGGLNYLASLLGVPTLTAADFMTI